MASVFSSFLRKPVDNLPMRFRTLPEWLDWQEGLHFTAIELGLDRCRKVAETMNLLPPPFTVISIAGTNGKGSCARMLQAILKQAGYRVGTYTSPHLMRYNERISVNGIEVDDASLCQSFARIDQARGNISLTYFEFGTLAAIDLFHQANIDIAVMEVGLGGRLDAVNMLDADVALISTIDLDHENWLGHDRDQIGREKAGIFRSMRPAICADPVPPASIQAAAEQVGALYYLSGRDFRLEKNAGVWTWQSGVTRFDNLPVPGGRDYQMRNAAGVLMVLEVLAERFPVEIATILACLQEFRLPGRFEVIPGEVPLILDVAHNRQAAAILAENLADVSTSGRNLILAGMLKDKNHTALFESLAPLADKWYIATLKDERGAEGHVLADALRVVDPEADMKCFEEINEAFEQVFAEAGPGDRIIVTGSFLTVGAAVRWLGRSR